MTETIVVEARIDVNARPPRVTLKGLQTGLPPRQTFRVMGGDILTWKLKDASGTPTPFAAQVQFDTPVSGPALFANQNIFEARRDTITSEKVSAAAKPRDPIAPGTQPVEYHYHVMLENPPGTLTELQCFWSDGSVAPMGGGEKGPRPPRG